MRARAVPSPRRRAGTVAHCSSGHPGRRGALGAWRGPAAICMRSSHKGSRSGARGRRAPPGPGAILRPGGGNSSPPEPGPPLRVNGRGRRRLRRFVSRPGQLGPRGTCQLGRRRPPRQRPSPMLISLAARLGGRPGREPPTFPARAPAAARPRVPRRGSPTPHSPPTRSVRPSGLEPPAPVRKLGPQCGSGQPGGRRRGPRPCSHSAPSTGPSLPHPPLRTSAD